MPLLRRAARAGAAARLQARLPACLAWRRRCSLECGALHAPAPAAPLVLCGNGTPASLSLFCLQLLAGCLKANSARTCCPLQQQQQRRRTAAACRPGRSAERCSPPAAPVASPLRQLCCILTAGTCICGTSPLIHPISLMRLDHSIMPACDFTSDARLGAKQGQHTETRAICTGRSGVLNARVNWSVHVLYGCSKGACLG